MTKTPDRKIKKIAAALLPVLFLFLLALPAACATGTKTITARKTVILLSMDGVRWDYPTRDHLPAFASMAADGLRAGRMTPPFPSLTFPSHSTLATGCYANKHGIIANSFLDRASGRRFSESGKASWLLEPPLWVLAERAGLKSAVCAWPCSLGKWHGSAPTYYQPFDRHRRDEQTADWIISLLRKAAPLRPALIMAWTHGADGPGHAQGPDGPAVHSAMRRADALLIKLRAAIKALGLSGKVDLIVLSDHGMAEVTRIVDVVKLIPKHGYYPYIATSGPICNIYVKDASQREAVAAGLKGLPPGVKVYTKGTLPPSLHYDGSSRTGDFVLICPQGLTFASYSRNFHRRRMVRGMHGYIPTLPDMGGIFYAEGPDFRAGSTLPEVRAVDVAPTICALLHISPPPHADGHSILKIGVGRTG